MSDVPLPLLSYIDLYRYNDDDNLVYCIELTHILDKLRKFQNRIKLRRSYLKESWAHELDNVLSICDEVFGVLDSQDKNKEEEKRL
jgi:hypothetical protein